jgi:hypothetical protein
VPSFRHEILVDLFRADGELAVELLRSRAGLAVDHARVEHGSSDLSQVVPAEYRADAVLVLRDRSDRPVTGVVVEVQRHVDRDKRRSWPVYVTALRAKLDCAVVLVVIAPDPDVAAWARQPIELGHPGFRLEPVVISFEDVPGSATEVARSGSPSSPSCRSWLTPSSTSPSSRSKRSPGSPPTGASYTWTSS